MRWSRERVALRLALGAALTKEDGAVKHVGEEPSASCVGSPQITLVH
jgi:hypothetical protein